VTLDSFTLSSDSLTQLTSLDLASALNGWTNVTVNCDRDGFSADFTKLLFAGAPAGAAVSHIGYIDLTNGMVHDLTAPRQGTGFQASLLNEVEPAFLGKGGGVLDFGSDEVAYTEVASGDVVISEDVTTVSDPSQSTPIPWGSQTGLGGDGVDSLIDETQHPEAVIGTDGTLMVDAPESGFNPSGSVVVVDAEDSVGDTTARLVALPSDPSHGVGVSCSPRGGWEIPIGWVNDTELAMETIDSSNSSNVLIMTVNPSDLSMSCGPPLVPANNRNPGDFALTYDGTQITFQATDVTGTRYYEIPVAGGDPLQSTPAPALPSGLDIWASAARLK
jgi:hypothetical protein